MRPKTGMFDHSGQLNAQLIQTMIHKSIPPLLLASKSPRRQQLLREMGLEFEVMVREVEEVVRPGLSPAEVAEEIAKAKSMAYPDLAGEKLIISSDTVVAFDGEIMGKPVDKADGKRMLSLLSNGSHEVVSGVCFQHKGRFHIFHESTKVFFRTLTPEMIEYYLEEFQPYDKAGAYGIQEWIGKVGITHIEGDYYNVMGLPACRLYEELRLFAEAF